MNGSSMRQVKLRTEVDKCQVLFQEQFCLLRSLEITFNVSLLPHPCSRAATALVKANSLTHSRAHNQSHKDFVALPQQPKHKS